MYACRLKKKKEIKHSAMHTLKQIEELNMNIVTNLVLEYYFLHYFPYTQLLRITVNYKLNYELYCELLHTCIPTTHILGPIKIMNNSHL